MPRELPFFEPVTLKELRHLYAQNDAKIRRLVLEIVRYRQILEDIDTSYKSIQLSWDRDVGGHLVGLYRLQCAVHQERLRTAACKG